MGKLPEVKYGYAEEIIPYIKGLLAGDTADGLTPAEQAQNNQVWDRLGRGVPASPHRMGPPMAQPRGRAPAPQAPTPTPSPAYPLDWQARAQGVTLPSQPQRNPVNPEVAQRRNFYPDMGPPAPLGLLADGQNVNPPLGPMYNAPDTFSAPDIAKSIGSGVGQGVAKTLGLPGEIHNAAKALPFAPQHSMYDGLMNKYGQLFGLNHLPDQAEMLQIAQQKYPQLSYQPQTRTGQVAQAAGRYLPGTIGRGAGTVMSGLKNIGGIYPWMLGATTAMGDERNRNQGPVTNGNVTGGYF